MVEFNLLTFKRIEATGWGLIAFVLLFFFWYVFAFLGICYFIRSAYLKFKHEKLDYLPTDGKSVLVTGCDSGFGLATARRLHELGFTVFATCLDPDGEGGQSLKDLNSSRMVVLPLDVTSDEDVTKCLKTVKDKCDHTGLWGLINNAGLNFLGDVELTTMQQYLLVGNINIYGTVRTCRAFLPLIRQSRGRIINVTSVKGLLAIPTNAAYTISKFGSEAFSETLRQEMRDYGVTTIIVEPGNFGGITGCLQEFGLRRIKSQLDTQWDEASYDVRQFYGRAHLQQEIDDARKSAKTSHPTVEPILKAFEDGLRSQCPKVRYLVDGSNSYIDIYNTLARISPFLPQFLLDKIRAYFFPYIIYK